MSQEDVIQKYLERGTIKKRANFDTALCRFREAWAKERKALQELIVSSVDEQAQVEEEWNKLAKKVGQSKVLDVRHYVIKGLLEHYDK